MADRDDLYEDELAEENEDILEEEEDGPPPVGWVDALQDQFGSAPWWVISAVVHGVILMLMTLIIVSSTDGQEEVIPLDVAEIPPIEEQLERDILEDDRLVDMPEVETPIFTHEEPEVETHMETANNMDEETAKGQEDAISDVPLGQPGVVGSIGVGGGGGGAFGHRTGGGRRRAAFRNGGNRASEAAVDAALRWLARHQTPAGNWEIGRWGGTKGEMASVGVTGLGLLAFLGAGHTEKIGQFSETVSKATMWLISQQADDGSIGQRGVGHDGAGYNHPIAGLALAEAFGMGGNPVVKAAAQKAVDYSLNVHMSPAGGWRYSPGSAADSSVTGWFVMQLKSGKVAGLNVNPSGFAGAAKFLETVTTKEGEDGAGYAGMGRYTPGSPITVVRTAIVMLCYQFMGWEHDSPVLKGGADHVVTSLPDWGRGGGGEDYYYWYYGTLVMFQMGGNHWKAWNPVVRDMLVKNQHNTPANLELDGSWDPRGFSGSYGGRALATAMGALTLEVYYRYLPIYKQ